MRRVAVLLSSLPAATATELVESLDEESQTRVQEAVESLSGVDRAERDQILQDFRGKLLDGAAVSAAPTSPQTEKFDDEFEIRQNTKAATAASGPASLLNRQVAAVVSQWELPRTFAKQPHHENVFAFLDEVDDPTMVALLCQEHPQVIALVFASITPKQAARILPCLDSDIQSETVRRIGRLDEVPEATASEVAAHLRERVNELQYTEFNSGQQALQAIIEAMPDEFGERSDQPAPAGMDPLRGAADPLGEFSPRSEPIETVDESATLSLAKPAQQATSTAATQQYLLQLPRAELCLALGKVNTRDALLTLCGLPNDVAEQALSILPRAQAKRVRRDMANLGQLQLREIDEAKEKVARVSLETSERATSPIAA